MSGREKRNHFPHLYEFLSGLHLIFVSLCLFSHHTIRPLSFVVIHVSSVRAHVEEHVTLQGEVAAEASHAAPQQEVCPPLQQPLLLLLQLHVRARERVEDGGDGESHEEDPAQDAAQSHHLPRDGPRHHVSVAHGCHGDDSPPVSGGDAGELLSGGHFVLDQVQQGGVQRDGHAQEEHQQAKLPGAAARRQAQRLQTQGVACQPHHVEDAQRSEDAQDQTHFVQVAAAGAQFPLSGGGAVHQQGDVVGQNSHHVDQVEGLPEEGDLPAVLDEAQGELQREPGHAHRLNDEDVVAHPGTHALEMGDTRERGHPTCESSDSGREMSIFTQLDTFSFCVRIIQVYFLISP